MPPYIILTSGDAFLCLTAAVLIALLIGLLPKGISFWPLRSVLTMVSISCALAFFGFMRNMLLARGDVPGGLGAQIGVWSTLLIVIGALSVSFLAGREARSTHDRRLRNQAAEEAARKKPEVGAPPQGPVKLAGGTLDRWA